MNVFVLKTIFNYEGLPIGQEPDNIEVSENIVNLVQKEYVTKNEYNKIIQEAGKVSYIAIKDTFYKLDQGYGYINKIPAERFVGDFGPYHILTGSELDLALESKMRKGYSYVR